MQAKIVPLVLFVVALSLSPAANCLPTAPTATPTTASPTTNTTGDDACFLNRFRGLTLEQIKTQSINWEKSLESSVSSTIFGISLLGVSVAFMVFGWWLGPVLFFLLGLVGGAVGTFYVIDLTFDALNKSNCYVLGFGSLFGGLLLGLLLLKLAKLALFCLGAALGAVIGYEVYLVALHHIQIGTFAGYDGMYWISISGCALVFGIAALTTKKSLIIVTTSICGAFGFTLAFDQLFLTQVDGGHFDMSKMNLQNIDTGEAPYFYGLLAAVVVLSLLAMLTQRQLSSRHRSKGKVQTEDRVVLVEPERRYFAV